MVPCRVKLRVKVMLSPQDLVSGPKNEKYCSGSAHIATTGLLQYLMVFLRFFGILWDLCGIFSTFMIYWDY